MKRNEIPDVDSWNLHQLARAVSDHSNGIKRAWTAVHEACTFVKSLEEKVNTSTFPFFRCPEESLQVAIIAATEMHLGLATAIAAILTPPFLAGLIEQEEVTQRFGAKAASILTELDALKSCKLQSGTIRNYPSIPDLTSPHILAILLQICDIIRVHCSGVILENDETTSDYFSSQLLFELKCFYIPLSHRIQLYNVQTKLADFWLKRADTLSYYAITAKLGMTKVQRQKRLDLISEEVYSVVKNHGIDFVMKKRVKSVYSIWRKIQKLKVEFNQINDLAAIRIIIMGMQGKTLAEEKIVCWKVLSIISEIYEPMCSVIRDWISVPRVSSYESLHLTFETNKYGRLEVQIRTERMDYIAEQGEAAHWKYKL
ncbi:bifunctional (p)ppGpp synthetase/guanosine-3',5'-bis(diphosphate) 3'-pyrophosphohydrolase [Candidatus Cardinium hertigii]|jgi:GTP pyrophosphokinase|nr:bifunctional (p)ppGpp synthetase/guanosine-3',5'-bis(diphosphate) 3'-pyrophosphohydrolase [Candidatus Cardinium hertigii]